MHVEPLEMADYVLDRVARCNDGAPTDDRKPIVAEIE